MLHIDYQRWNQDPKDLLNLALTAEHPRTRERFLAVYEISTGKNTIQVSKEIGRHHQTVMDWVHRYNQRGMEALVYQHSGGHRPLFVKKSPQP